MVPKDVLVLIPGACEYVILQGKKDFADVINLRVLRWPMILDYLSRPNIITRLHVRGRKEGQSQW